MIRTDDAILLGTRELGDADVIGTFLTRTHGLVRGVAKSARRSRRRFGGALESMAEVRLRWTERDGRDLQRLDEADLQRSHARAQADPAVQAACAVFAELLQSFGEGGADDARPFRLLSAALDALERGEPVLPVVRYFEAWLLRIHGMAPDLGACAICHVPVGGEIRVSRSDGSARCRECASRDGNAVVRLDGDALRFLAHIGSEPPRDLAAFEPAARCGGGLESMHCAALRHYLERPLRTYRHLAHATESTAPPVPRTES